MAAGDAKLAQLGESSSLPPENQQLHASALISPPTVIPRAEHGIGRNAISPGALKVIEVLQGAGFAAYIVGGGIRDLLLDQPPKDFDVVTDATPEQIRRLFRNARLIGRRFRLAHVRIGREIIEVATFRGAGQEAELDHRNGRIISDNVYGSEEEDARRRDFTINALMYDPATETLRDHVDGYQDVKNRRLRLIGDPVTRFREDPVRLLRAVRFITKLGLTMEPETAGPVVQMAPLLAGIPRARLLEETLKVLLSGRAWDGYRRLVQFRLWQELFPGLYDDPSDPPALVRQALISTDERIANDKPVTPGFLFAALMWPRVKPCADELIAGGMLPAEALAKAGEEVFAEHTRRVSIHRRFTSMAKDIWMLQPRFLRRSGKRSKRLLSERRFRAAYDFLLLRVPEEPELKEVAEWWTRVQEPGPEPEPEPGQKMTRVAPARRPRKTRHRR